MPEYSFPADFVWGAATASYQIEGGAFEDGRGESIWDRFSHTPGKVHNGDTGDVATDHYHRWREDIAIMTELGLNAYRFSIAWPRIIPDGDGAVNEAGLAFYDRLVDALLAANITPFVTLYHWDLPQALQDRQNGWASPAIVDQFVRYADVVSRCLGDRVKYWATFNEPHVFITHGYIGGEHAPGIKDRAAGYQAAHYTLLAHGHAVPVLRQNAGPEAKVGIVYNLSPVEAASDAPDVLRRVRLVDAQVNRWFEEPVLKGRYPDALKEVPEHAAIQIGNDDMAVISTPIDFVGVNYYSRIVVGDAARKKEAAPVNIEDTHYEGDNRTAMGWEIYPPGLYNTLKWLHDEYAIPALYVTENGAAFDDVLSPEGRVHDQRRVSYLREHFRMAARAIQDGVPLRGYFVWSLLDNFEWAYGYSKRFGIVYVDYPTGRRYWKDSAYFYRSVIQANGL